MENESSPHLIVVLSLMGGVVLSAWLCCCIFLRKATQSMDDRYQVQVIVSTERRQNQMSPSIDSAPRSDTCMHCKQ